MAEGLIGLGIGIVSSIAIYSWAGIAGELAERNARIRRASFRSRESQWVKL